ncbi:integrase core domain-containing protein [Elizabethkingia ursingii]
MNGIIKNEFFPKRIYQNHKEAKKAIDRIVHTYNDGRPHSSLDYLTPNKAHAAVGVLKKRWNSIKEIRLLNSKKKYQLILIIV